MKKMIVMAVLGLMGTQFAKAQVQKGNFLVGGNVGVQTASTKVDGSDDKNTSTNFNISPKVGYAVSDKWVVGVFAGAEFGTTKRKLGVPNEVETKTNLIAPGVFVRNYNMLGASKVAIFGEANVSYGFGSTKVNGTKSGTVNELEANVVPGIAYFVTKRFTLEGVFGGITYRNRVEKPEPSGTPKTTTSSFGVSFTDQFQVGVSWLF